MTEIEKLERKVLAATMARCETWLKEYPDGMRPANKGGIKEPTARKMIQACIALREARLRSPR